MAHTGARSGARLRIAVGVGPARTKPPGTPSARVGSRSTSGTPTAMHAVPHERGFPSRLRRALLSFVACSLACFRSRPSAPRLAVSTPPRRARTTRTRPTRSGRRTRATRTATASTARAFRAPASSRAAVVEAVATPEGRRSVRLPHGPHSCASASTTTAGRTSPTTCETPSASASAGGSGSRGCSTSTGPVQTRTAGRALQGIPTRSGFDRDEYPPAVAREGGKGAHVRYVRSSENRSAGPTWGTSYGPTAPSSGSACWPCADSQRWVASVGCGILRGRCRRRGHDAVRPSHATDEMSETRSVVH